MFFLPSLLRLLPYDDSVPPPPSRVVPWSRSLMTIWLLRARARTTVIDRSAACGCVVVTTTQQLLVAVLVVRSFFVGGHDLILMVRSRARMLVHVVPLLQQLRQRSLKQDRRRSQLPLSDLAPHLSAPMSSQQFSGHPEGPACNRSRRPRLSRLRRCALHVPPAVRGHV